MKKSDSVGLAQTDAAGTRVARARRQDLESESC
jgi:hypothetical protein